MSHATRGARSALPSNVCTCKEKTLGFEATCLMPAGPLGKLGIQMNVRPRLVGTLADILYLSAVPCYSTIRARLARLAAVTTRWTIEAGDIGLAIQVANLTV